MAAMAEPVIATRKLTKRYGNATVVSEVDLEFLPGEVVGLVGENGAGKSTTIGMLCGAVSPTSGSIEVGGESHREVTPAIARTVGIEPIWQEPVLVDTLTVAENLFVGRELTRFGIFCRRQMRRQAAEWLAKVDADIPVDAIVGSLPPADRQTVEIARAVGAGARVIFFDEPTASLGPRETERLFNIIRKLSGSGCAVVYVSHRLEEIFAICDRIEVLRDGALVASYRTTGVDEATLVSAMAGVRLGVEERRREERPLLSARVLELDDLEVTDGGSVSLDIRQGEIHVIAGIVGSGRSEVLEAVAGLRRPTRGRMTLEGRDFQPASPGAAARDGVGYVPEDRLKDALFPLLSVARNVAAAGGSRYTSSAGFTTAAAEREIARPLVERIRVKPPNPNMVTGSMSGGNQQKVVLARSMVGENRLMLFDEPTRGVDVGAKADIHAAIRDLAAAGRSVLMVSSDLREVLTLADRITVVAKGSSVATFPGTASEDEIMAAATGEK